MNSVVAGLVKKNERIAGDVYEMIIGTNICDDYVPGQFINIYLDDKSMLLPRPISICNGVAGSVSIVYRVVGKGTLCLSRYSQNQTILHSSPLGNGYTIQENLAGIKVAVVGGGIGIPPLVGLTRALRKRGAEVRPFLGYNSEIFLADKFESPNISTEDGRYGHTGNAVEMVRNRGQIFDEYYACGPKAMLKALYEHTAEVGRNVQVSVEERMGCGYGACVGCACKVGGEIKSVCKDGPVFFGKELVWD